MTTCERVYNETLATLQQAAAAYRKAKQAHLEARKARKADRATGAKAKIGGAP
jgi:hypothetical protein